MIYEKFLAADGCDKLRTGRNGAHWRGLCLTVDCGRQTITLVTDVYIFPCRMDYDGGSKTFRTEGRHINDRKLNGEGGIKSKSFCKYRSISFIVIYISGSGISFRDFYPLELFFRFSISI